MNAKIQEAINNQIREEFYSGYLYLSMAAYCGAKTLNGFENWFRVQAQEERDHALGFYNYMLERGGEVKLQALDQPPSSFKGPLELFEAALKHEKHITGKINELFELAANEKDFAFQSFLKWYIDEQVEEEATASEMIDKVKMVGEKGEALYMLDQELGARTYTPSSILKAE